jgi:anti-sigma B factor antagonist
MTNSLQIGVERSEAFAVMVVRGRIDIGSSPQMRDELLALLRTQTPPGAIAIDLAGVAYMDTSGMATLVEALKFARMGNVRMHLRGLQGRLLHLFQSTGIGSLFDTSETTSILSAKEVS